MVAVHPAWVSVNVAMGFPPITGAPPLASHSASTDSHPVPAQLQLLQPLWGPLAVQAELEGCQDGAASARTWVEDRDFPGCRTYTQLHSRSLGLRSGAAWSLQLGCSWEAWVQSCVKLAGEAASPWSLQGAPGSQVEH